MAGTARVIRAFRPTASLRSIRIPLRWSRRARAPAGPPGRDGLRGPVRVGGSDLRADHRSTSSAGRPTSADSPGGSSSSSPARGSRPGSSRCRPSGSRRSRRSSLGAAAQTGIVVPAAATRRRRGAGRPGRHRCRRGALRRPPGRVPVRWPEHARRRRDDLQRLRPTWLLRARRGGLPGRRGRGRPGSDRRAPEPAVPRGAARPPRR